LTKTALNFSTQMIVILHMKPSFIKITGLALALTASAYACNCGCHDHGKEGTGHEKATTTESAETTVKKIIVSGNDTMQFDNKSIELKAGEKTIITFKNSGNLPKEAMGHNLVILKPGTDPVKFGNAAISAKETEYIPQDEENKALVIAHTKILGPGEEESIEVTLEAGEYPYTCTFPGHANLMKGVITVK